MKQNIITIAETIYNAHYGHLDDRDFKASKTGEIIDWLETGDPVDASLGNLITEWGEYDQEEIKRNA